jgi:hypothetical protein
VSDKLDPEDTGMDEIKSALEIAMEKAEKAGEATEEERLTWKYVPEGERLAAKYMQEDINLPAELGKFHDNVVDYVRRGAMEVLVRNIDLPRSEAARKNSKKAMEGVKSLKKDRTGVENILTNIRRVFSHYTEQGEQQRKQAYDSLKAQFEARIQQAMRQQMGLPMGVKIDVEKQPQFQEEWRRIQSQMDSQYLKLLGEYREELLNIS